MHGHLSANHDQGLIIFVFLGTYKRSDDETFIDVGFDVNGTKHLDASLGYTRTRFNHGYIYQPKVYLAINSERVAALSGISTQY